MGMEITKGYKKGRAVLFYDVLDLMEHKTMEKVPKAQVVGLCNEGKISNAKIQMWEGKPIVRVKTANLPLVQLSENDEVLGSIEKATRTRGNKDGKAREDVVISIANKGVQVGKLNSKKRVKESTSFAGYDYKNVVEQREAKRAIDFSKFRTVEELYDYIAKDFNIKNVELYKKEIGKKIKMEKEIKSLTGGTAQGVAYTIATYLMNMAYNEINETYYKYL